MKCPSRHTANTSARPNSSLFWISLLFAALPACAQAGEWVESKPVMFRGDIAMTYRATLAGDWLVVEAKHSPKWHSYAMDNVQRARKASGKQTPETELPTRIAVSGALKPVGPWKQTAPKDLSKAEIQWYSWGFEGTARFAVKVERAEGGEATITLNAQACNETSCSMVRDLRLVLAVPGGDSLSSAPAEIAALVDVESE